MTLYVFDLDCTTARVGGDLERDWPALLATKEFQLLQWELGTRVSPEPGRGDLVIAHGADAAGILEPMADRGTYVLAIGGGGMQATAISTFAYSRRAPVGSPTDDSFTKRFNEFISDFRERGTARWELIEPPSDAEMVHGLAILCEGFLLAHSAPDLPSNGAARLGLQELMTPGFVDARAIEGVRRFQERTESPDWWLQCLQPQGAEAGGTAPFLNFTNGLPIADQLIKALASGPALSDVSLVSEAYLELVQNLTPTVANAHGEPRPRLA